MMRVVLIVLGLGSVCGATVAADPPPPPASADAWRRAQAAEQAGQWEQAVEGYLRAYLAGDQSAHVRERLQVALRFSAQAQRCRDAAVREFVASLTPAEAVNLYVEVLEKLHTTHADRQKVTLAKLFAAGLEELHRALDDSAFVRDHIPTASATSIRQFQLLLRTQPPTHSLAATRQATVDLVRRAMHDLGLMHPAAVAMELLHGACHGLNDNTIYLLPRQTRLEELPPAPTVTAAELRSQQVGYLRLTAFRPTTPTELDTALARLRSQGVRSLVLDLRNNTGGHFSAGLQVAQRFVSEGILARTHGQDPEFANRVFAADRPLRPGAAWVVPDVVPVVVLINSKTMSTAEVVAAALKNRDRVTLVGMPTFGKGTIQCPVRLSAADRPDGSGVVQTRSGVLVMTVANVQAGPNQPFSGVGVLPDVVERDPDRQLQLAQQLAQVLSAR